MTIKEVRDHQSLKIHELLGGSCACLPAPLPVPLLSPFLSGRETSQAPHPVLVTGPGYKVVPGQFLLRNETSPALPLVGVCFLLAQEMRKLGVACLCGPGGQYFNFPPSEAKTVPAVLFPK